MPTKSPATTEPLPTKTQSTPEPTPSREAVFDIFRRWGYLQASLDPLGQYLPPEPFPTPAPDGPAAEEARRYYCGPIGAEFMHIPSPEAPRLDPGAPRKRHRAQSSCRQRPHRPEAHPLRSHPRRPLRAGHPAALPRHQALLAGGADGADPVFRSALHHRRRQRRLGAPSSP